MNGTVGLTAITGNKERQKAIDVNGSFFQLLLHFRSNEKALTSFEKNLLYHSLKDNKEKKADLEKRNNGLGVIRKYLDNAQIMTRDVALDASEYRNIKTKLEP